MQTLKIKYYLEDKSMYSTIRKYMRQYSSCLHFMYNRVLEGKNEKECRSYFPILNNIDDLDFIMKECAIKEAIQIKSTNKDKKVIFGGKKNFFDRVNNKISKEEYKEKRLSPLYVIGRENLLMGNQKFKIQSDLKTIIFQPKVKNKISLRLYSLKRNYAEILNKLYLLGLDKKVCITYKLDLEYIYLTFDESILKENISSNKIENRVFAIDMNPNYIGWSVVDWKSSSSFNVISSGIISTKKLNDKDNDLKGKGHSSSSDKRKHISDKRNTEIYEISKNLINKAIYYGCSIFSIEKLDMKNKDHNKGKRLNRLINNQWNRNSLVNNLKKRCSLHNIFFNEVEPAYSSFIGNFLFRDINKPDMILASIEIGRRGYEFYNQYITKKNIKQKNIISPNISDFIDRFTKSMEEFNISGQFDSLKDIYYHLKESKMLYRLSLDQFDLKFSSFINKKSDILVYQS